MRSCLERTQKRRTKDTKEIDDTATNLGVSQEREWDSLGPTELLTPWVTSLIEGQVPRLAHWISWNSFHILKLRLMKC